MQWIFLKAWLPKARGWVLFNVLDFGLVHALNDAGFFNNPSNTISLLIDGLVIGMAQAIALRHVLSRSYVWPLLMSIIWLFAFEWAYAFENIYGNNPLLVIFIGYGTAGLIIGGIMAIFFKVTGKTWIAHQIPVSGY